MSFIFGGDTGLSYEQIQSQRRIAERLMTSNSRTPRNVGEGLHAIGQALAAASINKRADQREAELRGAYNTERDAFWDSLISSAQPSTGTGSAPQPLPEEYNIDEGDPRRGMMGTGASRGSHQNLRDGIRDTAEALGVEPMDIGTTISYETGGSFNPTQAGPTTQHGQHKGFIQFGEPQAAAHGVDWNDPMGSQLGEDGAIVSYLQDAGVQPGMELLDIYSAVNAGQVGRYNASDANNGGAPGTVRDKVENQMAGHRANADALLNGRANPNQNGVPTAPTVSAQNAPPQQNPQVASNGNIQQIVALLSNPMASPGDKAALSMMLQREMQASDPLRQLQIQQAQLDLEQDRNPTPDPARTIEGADGYSYWLDGSNAGQRVLPDVTQPQPAQTRIVTGEEASALGLDPTKQYNLTEGPDGIQAKQIGGNSTTVNVNNGNEPPNDAALRKKLGEAEGTLWGTYLEAGNTASALNQDMQVIDELIKLAPQGPISGRLAEVFPGVSSAGDAFQSVVKRIAPTLRAEGSGSTSDIEYEGMLRSLPALGNKPEANVMIAQIMRQKAAINMERAQIVQDYQSDLIDVQEARTRMRELDQRSIMTPEMKQALSGLSTGSQDGGSNELSDEEYLKSLGLE